MRMGKLRIGYVCVVSFLFVFGCEPDKTQDPTTDNTKPTSEEITTNAEQDSVWHWEVSGSSSIDIMMYQGEGPTMYNGNVRHTRLTLTFQSRQNEVINGIHIAKVEVYYEDRDGPKVEEMPAAEFQLGTSWDGSLMPHETVEATYSRNDRPSSGAGLSGTFYAVVVIEADGGISGVVTTAPTRAEVSMCYLALPPPGD